MFNSAVFATVMFDLILESSIMMSDLSLIFKSISNSKLSKWIDELVIFKRPLLEGLDWLRLNTVLLPINDTFAIFFMTKSSNVYSLSMNISLPPGRIWFNASGSVVGSS